jgi:hypothetical protein
MTDNHGLSAENTDTIARLREAKAISPNTADLLTAAWAQTNALLDAAREESAARVKAEVEGSCSFWEPRPKADAILSLTSPPVDGKP